MEACAYFTLDISAKARLFTQAAPGLSARGKWRRISGNSRTSLLARKRQPGGQTGWNDAVNFAALSRFGLPEAAQRLVVQLLCCLLSFFFFSPKLEHVATAFVCWFSSFRSWKSDPESTNSGAILEWIFFFLMQRYLNPFTMLMKKKRQTHQKPQKMLKENDVSSGLERFIFV